MNLVVYVTTTLSLNASRRVDASRSSGNVMVTATAAMVAMNKTVFAIRLNSNASPRDVACSASGAVMARTTVETTATRIIVLRPLLLEILVQHKLHNGRHRLNKHERVSLQNKTSLF
jgi:uncharacterized protein involved in response to NO